MDFLNFLFNYKEIIIFYLIAIIFLIIFRKKVTVQAKVIFLIRTKLGIKLMKWVSNRFRETIKIIGYSGIGIGFIGMIAMSFFLIKNVWDIFFASTKVAGVSLVLPGVNVPGMGVLSFWHWIISLFILAVIHEFGHGIVAKAHGLKIKATGIVFFGPIIGAFVEPDEEKIRKEKDHVQYSIYAAGPFMNILCAALVFMLMMFAVNPYHDSITNVEGVEFSQFYEGDFPIEKSGLIEGDVIKTIDGKKVDDVLTLSNTLQRYSPGETIDVSVIREGEVLDYSVELGSNPSDENSPFLGVTGISNSLKVKEGVSQSWYDKFLWIKTLLSWLFVLNLGIGLFNLLPISILDGGRMMEIYLNKSYGNKSKGIYTKISLFFIIIIIASLLLPQIL